MRLVAFFWEITFSGRQLMRIVQVKVKPNARENSLKQQADGTWIAEVKALPIDGKANEALIALMADYFKLRKTQVSIKSGASSKLKRIEIDD